MAVVTSKKGSVAVIKSTATETITLANLQVAGETVNSATITGIWWSGTVTIARGANKLVDLAGSGSWDLHQSDIALTENATSNIAITITGTGSVVVRVSKQSTYVSDYSSGG